MYLISREHFEQMKAQYGLDDKGTFSMSITLASGLSEEERDKTTAALVEAAKRVVEAANPMAAKFVPKARFLMYMMGADGKRHYATKVLWDYIAPTSTDRKKALTFFAEVPMDEFNAFLKQSHKNGHSDLWYTEEL